jgi:hypothetical protein
MTKSGRRQIQGARGEMGVRYTELEACKNGHCNVPSTLKNKLSRWVGIKDKNRRNKEAKLTAESAHDSIDFRWRLLNDKISRKLQRIRDETGVGCKVECTTRNTATQRSQWKVYKDHDQSAWFVGYEEGFAIRCFKAGKIC